MINRICKTCKKEFKVKNYRKHTAKFCSFQCCWNGRKGKHPLAEFKKDHHYSPATEFKKGNISYSKLHPECMCRGKENPMWKGGKQRTKEGYIYILNPGHPHAIKRYVLEHRLVVEKQIGRYLLPSEKVHHLGKKGDNRPHMLMAFNSQNTHIRFERGGIVKTSEIIFDGRTLV